MTTITVPSSEDLTAALDALHIPWTAAKPPNGARGLITVTLDPDADARLETLISALSQIRWSYTPARIVQMEFAGWDPEGGGHVN